MIISIITASYNREKLLTRLFESLCNQTCKNFEWIVIDDGSRDNTEQLINEFIDKKIIDINYIKKINGGKHTALNVGVDIAKGEFSFFVDSDDYLPNNSIEIICNKIDLIKKNPNYGLICGICGDKQNINGNHLEAKFKDNFIGNYLDFRYKLKIIGDKAEVFKTQILQEYKFPEFEGEKFCPEGLIWNRIAQNYEMLFFKDVIYYCEYQEEGLTAKTYEVRKKSPQATLLYYKELFKDKKVPKYYRLRAGINFLRFYF